MRKHRKNRDIPLQAAELLDDITASIIWGILVILMVLTLWMLTDLSNFNSHGAQVAAGHDLKELNRINPDTAAWLEMKNTHIDYPVVKGKDNFEYLDLDITRNFYVGGTLFIDAANRKDLSDEYIIIHGHHMSDGIMFGDLDKYLDDRFMRVSRKGTLKTLEESYDLEVFAAGTADAYDSGIYNMKADLDTHLKAIDDLKIRSYGIKETVEKVLVLSTCTDRMDDTRTVVFCSMKRSEVPPEVENG